MLNIFKKNENSLRGFLLILVCLLVINPVNPFSFANEVSEETPVNNSQNSDDSPASVKEAASFSIQGDTTIEAGKRLQIEVSVVSGEVDFGGTNISGVWAIHPNQDITKLKIVCRKIKPVKGSEAPYVAVIMRNESGDSKKEIPITISDPESTDVVVNSNSQYQSFSDSANASGKSADAASSTNMTFFFGNGYSFPATITGDLGGTPVTDVTQPILNPTTPVIDPTVPTVPDNPNPPDPNHPTNPPIPLPECAQHSDCDDHNPCTTDLCALFSGTCTHTPVTVDDGNLCTTDSCDAGTGIVHTAVSMDDNNVCTTDSCDPAVGVIHTPVTFNDNNACTTDSCNQETGIVHAAVSIDDNNVCTVDSCDPNTGIAHTAVICAIGESCNPTQGCVTNPPDVNIVPQGVNAYSQIVIPKFGNGATEPAGRIMGWGVSSILKKLDNSNTLKAIVTTEGWDSNTTLLEPVLRDVNINGFDDTHDERVPYGWLGSVHDNTDYDLGKPDLYNGLTVNANGATLENLRIFYAPGTALEIKQAPSNGKDEANVLHNLSVMRGYRGVHFIGGKHDVENLEIVSMREYAIKVENSEVRMRNVHSWSGGMNRTALEVSPTGKVYVENIYPEQSQYGLKLYGDGSYLSGVYTWGNQISAEILGQSNQIRNFTIETRMVPQADDVGGRVGLIIGNGDGVTGKGTVIHNGTIGVADAPAIADKAIGIRLLADQVMITNTELAGQGTHGSRIGVQVEKTINNAVIDINCTFLDLCIDLNYNNINRIGTGNLIRIKQTGDDNPGIMKMANLPATWDPSNKIYIDGVLQNSDQTGADPNYLPSLPEITPMTFNLPPSVKALLPTPENGVPVSALTIPVGTTAKDQYMIPAFGNGLHYPAGQVFGFDEATSIVSATANTQNKEISWQVRTGINETGNGDVANDDFETDSTHTLMYTEHFHDAWMAPQQVGGCTKYVPEFCPDLRLYPVVVEPIIRNVTLKGRDGDVSENPETQDAGKPDLYDGLLTGSNGGKIIDTTITGIPGKALDISSGGGMAGIFWYSQPYESYKRVVQNVHISRSYRGMYVGGADHFVSHVSAGQVRDWGFHFEGAAVQGYDLETYGSGETGIKITYGGSWLTKVKTDGQKTGLLVGCSILGGGNGCASGSIVNDLTSSNHSIENVRLDAAGVRFNNFNVDVSPGATGFDILGQRNILNNGTINLKGSNSTGIHLSGIAMWFLHTDKVKIVGTGAANQTAMILDNPVPNIPLVGSVINLEISNVANGIDLSTMLGWNNLINITTDNPASIKLPSSWGGNNKVYINGVLQGTSYTITGIAGANGSISNSGTIITYPNQSILYSFTPDSGYEVQDVIADGISAGPATGYLFQNINANHVLQVTFKSAGVAPIPVCGNGQKETGEACDDGNLTNNDGCSSSCQSEPGFMCSVPMPGHPRTCSPICGDGIIVGNETCDDGNVAASDGCNASCRIESGFNCAGTPSICTAIPVCGNSRVEQNEVCDEGVGNGQAGHCNSTCTGLLPIVEPLPVTTIIPQGVNQYNQIVVPKFGNGVSEPAGRIIGWGSSSILAKSNNTKTLEALVTTEGWNNNLTLFEPVVRDVGINGFDNSNDFRGPFGILGDVEGLADYDIGKEDKYHGLTVNGNGATLQNLRFFYIPGTALEVKQAPSNGKDEANIIHNLSVMRTYRGIHFIGGKHDVENVELTGIRDYGIKVENSVVRMRNVHYWTGGYRTAVEVTPTGKIYVENIYPEQAEYGLQLNGNGSYISNMYTWGNQISAQILGQANQIRNSTIDMRNVDDNNVSRVGLIIGNGDGVSGNQTVIDSDSINVADSPTLSDKAIGIRLAADQVMITNTQIGGYGGQHGDRIGIRVEKTINNAVIDIDCSFLDVCIDLNFNNINRIGTNNFIRLKNTGDENPGIMQMANLPATWDPSNKIYIDGVLQSVDQTNSNPNFTLTLPEILPPNFQLPAEIKPLSPDQNVVPASALVVPAGTTSKDQHMIPAYGDGLHFPAGQVLGFGETTSILSATANTKNKEISWAFRTGINPDTFETRSTHTFMHTEHFGDVWVAPAQIGGCTDYVTAGHCPDPRLYPAVLEPIIQNVTLKGFDGDVSDNPEIQDAGKPDLYDGLLTATAGAKIMNTTITGIPGKALDISMMGGMGNIYWSTEPFDLYKRIVQNVHISHSYRGLYVGGTDHFLSHISIGQVRDYAFHLEGSSAQSYDLETYGSGETGILITYGGSWLSKVKTEGQKTGISIGCSTVNGGYGCAGGTVVNDLVSSNHSIANVNIHAGVVRFDNFNLDVSPGATGFDISDHRSVLNVGTINLKGANSTGVHLSGIGMWNMRMTKVKIIGTGAANQTAMIIDLPTGIPPMVGVTLELEISNVVNGIDFSTILGWNNLINITTDNPSSIKLPSSSWGNNKIYINGVLQGTSYTITAATDANGSISTPGTITAYPTQSVLYSISPNAGFEVQDVLVDGVSVGAVTNYSFNNINSSHTIQVTFKTIVTPPPPPPLPVCGNNVRESSEACDDGNLTNNDGCSSSCRSEPGFICSVPTPGHPMTCGTICGDSIIAGAELCDDGSNNGKINYCNTTCNGQTPIPCGNGTIEDKEECDDGNQDNGDGCSTSCEMETGWYCFLNPQVCETRCGDGLVAGTETCDDGNTTSGDGCSGACQVESGFSWSDSVVTPGCSDGVDNDGDGLVDQNDPGCMNGNDADEKDTSLFVSLTGDDANPGTFAQPFKTLEKARDASRALLISGLTSDLVINLRGGTYSLTDTFKLDERDSGNNGHQVIWRSYPGETAQLTTAEVINPSQWQVYQGSILRTPIAAGREFFTLYEEDNDSHELKRGRMAQEPDYDVEGSAQPTLDTYYITDGPRMRDNDGCLLNQFRIRPGDIGPGKLDPSADYSHAKMFSMHANWLYEVADIRSIDFSDQKVVLAEDLYYAMPFDPTTSGMYNQPDKRPCGPTDEATNPASDHWLNNRYRIMNVFSFLDQPSEFFIDDTNHYLYYMPRNATVGTVYAPRTNQAISLEGTAQSPIHDIEIHSLDIFGSDYASWFSGQYGNFPGGSYLNGAQTGSYIGDAYALILVKNGANIKITKNKIHHTGLHGINMVESKNSSVDDNDINNIGFVGVNSIHLDHYEKSGNSFINNRFSRTGLAQYTGGGLRVNESETITRNNSFNDVGGTPIGMYGSKNYIGGNDIGHYAIRTGDSGGIYIWSDPNNPNDKVQMPGIVIDHNYLHDYSQLLQIGNWGVYYDGNGVDGSLIKNNLGYVPPVGTTCPVLLTGSWNHVLNNIFVQNVNAVNPCAVAINSIYWPTMVPQRNNLILKNIVRRLNLDISFVWGVPTDDIVNQPYFRSAYNLLFSKGDTGEDWNYMVYANGFVPFARWQNEGGQDKGSIIKDPLFADPDHGDFTLPSNSPAFDIGFKPFNTKFGSQPENERAEEMHIRKISH